MSQRKAAASKPAPKSASKAEKPIALDPVAAKPPNAAEIPSGDLSADATKLAADIERTLRDGKTDTLSPEAFQKLMAALCRNYGAQREGGTDFLPVADRTSVSPTEIMMTTSGLLKAANLAVFELGMWQSWTGR